MVALNLVGSKLDLLAVHENSAAYHIQNIIACSFFQQQFVQMFLIM